MSSKDRQPHQRGNMESILVVRTVKMNLSKQVCDDGLSWALCKPIPRKLFFSRWTADLACRTQ